MPPLETSGLHQKAVLWAASGTDNYGDPKVGSPVEIAVRWEEGRREAVDAQGNAIAIEAVVLVDREIAIGSVLRLGTLAGLPTPLNNLKQVSFYEEVPDVKGRQVSRTVYLVNRGTALPTSA